MGNVVIDTVFDQTTTSESNTSALYPLPRGSTLLAVNVRMRTGTPVFQQLAQIKIRAIKRPTLQIKIVDGYISQYSNDEVLDNVALSWIGKLPLPTGEEFELLFLINSDFDTVDMDGFVMYQEAD